MTVKKNVTPATPRIPDSLIADRFDFKIKLEERIEKGRNLLNRSVTNAALLEELDSNFHKWNDYNLEYLKQSFNNENSDYRVDYNNAGSWSYGFLGGQDSPQEKYRRLREKISSKIDSLEKLVDKIDLLKSNNPEPSISKSDNTTPLTNENIFIVHGHNVAVQQSVARVIEKLGLNPIILHEQANNGRTIIEKFERHSEVSFAIILMTDDDEGKAKSEIDLKNRARQNVILELGYFIGKLGRERVLPLYSEGVELPSDIHGLLYTPIDKSENWKFAIVKELKAVGFNVDANKLL